MSYQARTSIAARILVVTLAAGLLTAGTHAQNKVVFVTSRTTDAGEFRTDELTGIPAADALCNHLALAATPPLNTSNGSYKAWLSDHATSPATTFTKASVPYVRPDGILIAKDWADLVDGTLEHPINRDENAHPVPPGSAVYTGTTSWASAGAHCPPHLDRTNLIPAGTFGRPHATSGYWTQRGILNCDIPQRWYCFQQ